MVEYALSRTLSPALVAQYQTQLPDKKLLASKLHEFMGKRVPVRTKAKLREAANEHMTRLERNPERVMSYFQDHRVRYAA